MGSLEVVLGGAEILKDALVVHFQVVPVPVTVLLVLAVVLAAVLTDFLLSAGTVGHLEAGSDDTLPRIHLPEKQKHLQ